MNYDQIIAAVGEHGNLSRDQAEAATQATLRTLAERISHGEAADVAERLPLELQRHLSIDSAAMQFDLDEFLRKVAEREGTSRDQAQAHCRAVLATLQETLGSEFRDVAAQLPDEFTAVLGRPT